jgi:hypothetical protein
MTKLGSRNYLLISEGVKMLGTFNPNEIFPIFEEMLLGSQTKEIWDFLFWVNSNREERAFGKGNYEERFSEFKRSLICE